MTIPNTILQEIGGSTMEIIGGSLLEENLSPLRDWEDIPDRKIY